MFSYWLGCVDGNVSIIDELEIKPINGSNFPKNIIRYVTRFFLISKNESQNKE